MSKYYYKYCVTCGIAVGKVKLSFWRRHKEIEKLYHYGNRVYINDIEYYICDECMNARREKILEKMKVEK